MVLRKRQSTKNYRKPGEESSVLWKERIVFNLAQFRPKEKGKKHESVRNRKMALTKCNLGEKKQQKMTNGYGSTQVQKVIT